jgi:hypothetical protein
MNQQKDWAKDIWVARDQYRVENFLLGCLTLPVVLVIVGVFLVMLSGCGPASQKINCTVYGVNCPQEARRGQ